MKPFSMIPDWAADAVWYQIFPERFRNACPESNPCVSDTGRRIKGWSISPWEMDWYARQDWEQKQGDFFHSVYARRFGGDLLGVRQKLGYLQDLGINAIYLNPVFMARSLHKYDATCYHHIDPTFGPDRSGDVAALQHAGETSDPATWIWTSADRYFLELVADIHAHGMRVIIDGVFNHTGTEFFAFKDLKKNGRMSPYRKWYKIQGWTAKGEPRYKGWYGHKSLPELGRAGDNLTPSVREHIFHVTRRWMDPHGNGDISAGVDGWRLDVAYCVPHGFWRDWRTLVKSINPEAYTCGEIVSLATSYLQGDELDSVMNYMWTYPTLGFFSPGKKPITAALLQRKLESLRKAYPDEVNYGLQNLLDSHDVGRVLTMLENPDVPRGSWDEFFNSSRVMAHPDLVTTRPGPAALQALRQMVVFQMTYLGAPMIYYGTEVGMWGGNDPDNRQPMLWADITYEQESKLVHGTTSPTTREPDQELFVFYQQAIRLRKDQRALRRGGLTWLPSDNPRLLAYIREMGAETITVLLNASNEPTTYVLDRAAEDLWTGVQHEAGTCTISPRGWLVLK